MHLEILIKNIANTSSVVASLRGIHIYCVMLDKDKDLLGACS